MVDDDDDKPVTLTADEARRIRAMLETHERAVWLWTAVGVWAKWIISVAAAVAVIKAAISGGIPGLSK